MRWQFLSLVFLGLVPATPTIGSTGSEATRATVAATVAVPSLPLSAPWVRDEAAMMLVGSALIGLAAAIRRSV